MKQLPDLGKLQHVHAREAWSHEAHSLTPWLAQNLDRLSEALGIQLEAEGIEQAVGTFSADILAREIGTDRRVLIENQLEVSDHTHLGQIMTYLAGLETEIMVWIAPGFREPHLSAIKWLNEHTKDPFAFFAVRLRVVRIGDSKLAPLFETIEKPNSWDREIAREASKIIHRSTLGEKRLGFWTALLEQYPEEAEFYAPDAASSRWRPVGDLPIRVVQYLAKTEVGVFVRPDRGLKLEDILHYVEPQKEVLEARLEVPFGPNHNGNLFASALELDTDNEANWPAAFEWLNAKANRYVQSLFELIEAK